MEDARRIAARTLPDRLDRRGFLRSSLAASAGGALLAAGCGSGGGKTATSPDAGASPTAGGATPAATANAAGVTPYVLTSEFVAGEDSRFAIGLIEKGGKLVKGAAVHLKFFVLGAADPSSGQLRGEGEAEYRELRVDGAHEHDGSAPGAQADDSIAFYVAKARFTPAGKWGVEVTATLPERVAAVTIQAPFTVLETSQTPGIGTVPPASKNDTFATNSNAESLCSRSPACPLHDKVIGDLLGKGRPLVVMFSTPAFCTSRFCGPVLEVLLPVVPVYQDRIDFVHIEVWQDFQLQQHRAATDEWKLPTEPYTFFIDGAGKVFGKVEAILTREELISGLDQLLQA